MPKHGPANDPAVPVDVLGSTDQVPLHALDKALFIGELTLDGSVRHVKGIMPIVYTARQEGLRTVYFAEDDAVQAGLVEGIVIISIPSLGRLVEHLYGLNPIAPFVPKKRISLDKVTTSPDGITDFADVKGQHHVKRALEIAAGGNHNIRLVGPPGTGKTILARALPGILPNLTYEEAFEVTRIYSVADILESQNPLMTIRPFRVHHHTISQAGLIGGGTIPRPGEVTLAHRGVLFLIKP